MSTKCRFRIQKDITQEVKDAIIPNPIQGLVDLPVSSCDVQVQFEDDCSVENQVTVTLVATNISPNSHHLVQVQDAFGNWEDTNQAVLNFENECVDNTTVKDIFYQAVLITRTLQGSGVYSIIISSNLFQWNTEEERLEIYNFINNCQTFFKIHGFVGTFVGLFTIAFYMPAVSNLSVSSDAITFDYNINIGNNDPCNIDEYNNSQAFIQTDDNFPFNFKDVYEFICHNLYTKPRSNTATFRVIKCDTTIEVYEVSVTDWENPCPTTRNFVGTFAV